MGELCGRPWGQCEVCKTFDKVPHIPIAGTSSASPFNGKVGVDLLYLDGAIALRAVDVVSKYSLLTSERSGNPQDTRGVLRSPRIAILAKPGCIRMSREVNGEIEFGRIASRGVA